MFKAKPKEKVDGNAEDLGEEILDVKFYKPEEIKELDLRVENRAKVIEKYQKGEEHDISVLWNKLNLLQNL